MPQQPERSSCRPENMAVELFSKRNHEVLCLEGAARADAPEV